MNLQLSVKGEYGELNNQKIRIVNRAPLMLALTIVMLVAAMWFATLSAHAADIASGTYDNVDWRLTSDGKLELGKSGETQTFADRYRNAEAFPWYEHRGSIKKIELMGPIVGQNSLSGMFMNETNLTEVIGWDLMDTSKVLYLDGVFRGNIKLRTVDVSKMDTSSALGISRFFRDCQSLESVDCSSWDLSNVINPIEIFTYCYKLKSVGNLSKWNIGTKVTNISYLFSDCRSLESLTGYENWDVSNVDSFAGVFRNCYLLKSVNTTKWNTSKGVYMNEMYRGLREVEELDASNIDTSKALQLYYLFADMPKLKTLKLNLDTSSAQRMNGMFAGDESLTSLDLSKLTTKSVDPTSYPNIGLSQMFQNCKNLETITGLASDLVGSNIDRTDFMFDQCNKLNPIDVSKYDMSNVGLMNNMFRGCTSVEKLDVKNWDTSSATAMNGLFQYCNALTELDVKGFKTDNVESFVAMFAGLENVEVIDVSKFKTGNGKEFWNMFQGCKKVEELDVSGWDTSNATLIQGMFSGCMNLESLDVSKFNTGKVENMASMFSNCVKLTNLDVSSFDTGNVKYMNAMFANLPDIEALDLSSFDTAKVENMNSMFSGNARLEDIKFGDDFKTDNVKDTSYMFNGCEALTKLDLSALNTGNVENFQGMFNGCTALTDLSILGLDTSKATDVRRMYDGCDALLQEALEVLDGGNLDEYSSLTKVKVEKAIDQLEGAVNAGDNLTPEMVKDMDENLEAGLIAAAKEDLSIAKNAADELKAGAEQQAADEAAAKAAESAKTAEQTKSPADIKKAIADAEAAKAAAEAAKAAAEKREEQLEKAVKSAEATGDAKAIAEAKAARDAAKADIDKAKADVDAAVAAADTALAKATDLGKGLGNVTAQQTDGALQNADKLIDDAKSSGDKAAADAALKAAEDALAKAKAELELMKKLYGENSPQAIAAQAKVNRASAAVEEAKKLVNGSSVQPVVGERFVVGDQTYEVLTVPASGNCSATLVKGNNAKTVVVPETVAYKSRTFEVNEINTKAFYKNTKKVTLGANVDTIDKQAFKGSKVKTVILKTKDLTKKGVKGSLKGSKVTTVKVKVGAKKANQKFVKKYKKFFTKANAGKKVTVK